MIKINKAGGSKTVLNGLNFENITSIENKLLENNYTKKILNNNKYGYYFEYNNSVNNLNVIYLKQTGFKLYFSKIFNINVYRQPDEAFLVKKDNIIYLKILEKKNQNVNVLLKIN